MFNYYVSKSTLMVKINELYRTVKKGKKVFSVEIMPLLSGSSLEDYDSLINPLQSSACQYLSVTQPASSAPKGGTAIICQYLKRKFDVEAMPHITGGNKTPQELENKIQELSYLGIENILALRGDEQQQSPITRSGVEIVGQLSSLRLGKYLKREVTPSSCYNFSLAIACYLEGHPATTKEKCWNDFKLKVETGADFALTQTFFIEEKYQEFQTWAEKNNIGIPIIPGIFIPRTPKDFVFLQGNRIGATLPSKLLSIGDRFANSPESFRAAIDEYMVTFTQNVLEYAEGVHFYSLNDTCRVAKIMEALK